jgi:AraC-like DNA-binding protein
MDMSFNPSIAGAGVLPPAERFHVWREEFALKFMHLDAAAPHLDAFDVDVSVMQLPRLLLSRYVCAPLDLIRTRQLVRDGQDGCSFLVCATGSIQARFGDVEFELLPGDAALIPHHHAGQVSTRTGARSFYMRFDREGAKTLAPSIDDMMLRKIGSGHSAVAVLASYCDHVLSADDDLSAPLASLASAQLRELAAHILNPASDIARSANYGGVKAARLRAVLNAVAAGLGDPGLSADSIGAGLGFSGRYVQQLMEGTGQSFSQHVRQSRLDEARRLLADPGATAQKVTDIALAVGFQDVSYFNREFRRRFGETPSDVRRGR